MLRGGGSKPREGQRFGEISQHRERGKEPVVAEQHFLDELLSPSATTIEYVPALMSLAAMRPKYFRLMSAHRMAKSTGISGMRIASASAATPPRSAVWPAYRPNTSTLTPQARYAQIRLCQRVSAKVSLVCGWMLRDSIAQT